MEYFGIFAFMMILCYSAYPSKVKKLETKVKKLEKQWKGKSAMSKLIEELVGKDCKIKSEKGISLAGKPEFECHVIDCDDDWLKICVKDKKNNEVVKLMRVEDVEEIEMIAG